MDALTNTNIDSNSKICLVLQAWNKFREISAGIIIFVHIVLPIIIGGLIYLIWRVDSLLMFQWSKIFGLYPYIENPRQHLYLYKYCIPEFIIYSLPDALWVYAATSLQCIIWRNNKSSASYIWISIPPSLAIGGELGQFVGFIPGTFCLNDLILCIFAAILAIRLLKKEMIR